MAAANKAMKETEKYIKFFSYKALQVIIHSRSGEKTKTSSKANAVGVDWFNVALPGNNIGNEIQREVKNEFGNIKAVLQEPLWLYVYLKTADGRDTLLESWNIHFSDRADPSIKSSFAVYNKLTMLLKSLIVVTRSLPAYKLTRRKDKDFSFYYRVCFQEPEGERAMDLPGVSKIGSVGTQFGSIMLSVHFQTKTSFYTYEDRNLTSANDSKKRVLIKMNKDDQLDLLNPLGPAAVEELRKAAFDDVTSSTASLPTSFTTLSPHNFDFSQMQEGIAKLRLDDISQPQSIGDINTEHRALAAFGDTSIHTSKSELPELPSTPPFLSFIQGKIEESMTEQSPRDQDGQPSTEKKEVETKDNQKNDNIESFVAFDSPDGETEPTEPTAQAVGFEDDFVLVEVRPAFAPQTGDAGQLYRECQNPPKLDMFSRNGDHIANDESLTDQIERFEDQLARYDEFFRNLEHMKVI